MSWPVSSCQRPRPVYFLSRWSDLVWRDSSHQLDSLAQGSAGYRVYWRARVKSVPSAINTALSTFGRG